MCFPVNFVKLSRTTFSIEHFWLLLLGGGKYEQRISERAYIKKIA